VKLETGLNIKIHKMDLQERKTSKGK